VLAGLFRQAWRWSAYWRLYPLWHLLRQAVRRRRPVAAWRSIGCPGSAGLWWASSGARAGVMWAARSRRG